MNIFPQGPCGDGFSICVLFPQALTEYRSELKDDPIISSHLVTLYDNLLEQNLIRVIEPFSRVQVPPAASQYALDWWPG